MDPWTLAYLAGHQSMSITKRYVHPQLDTILQAMENARGGHNSGHTPSPPEKTETRTGPQVVDREGENGAPGEIRTPDLLVRSQYIATPCFQRLNAASTHIYRIYSDL